MWYNDNELVAYPFDELATLTDDAGQPLNQAILADLSVVIPATIGQRLFVSAISYTASRLSVVISADNADKTPVAIAGVQGSVVPRQPYSLVPLISGVAGQFVPGEQYGYTTSVNQRFSSPSQSYLSPRSVFSLPMTSSSFSVAYANTLLNRLVDLIGAGDVEVVVEPRVLSGVNRMAAIIRLKESGLSGIDILRQYAQSLPRPEAGTCGDPQPITSINRVQADCCGRIFLEFRGCAEPIPIEGVCGVVLNCPEEAGKLCAQGTNFDPGSSQQSDICIEQGYPNPVDNPTNKPKLPPTWEL